MQSLVTLFLLCIGMGGGSYLAGYIPLSLSIPQDKLLLLTTFGSGLLIGTALTVIIPEGVASLYLSLSENPSSGIDRNIVFPQQTLGLSLILGFAFMFLVDQFGHAQQSHTKISVSELSDLELRNSSRTAAALGLLIHSAADGIALGAASLSGSSSSLEFIVFLAILLHKAPAAFGLSSFLLQQGTSRRSIRHQLLLFSLAAPVTALLTYFLLETCNVGFTNSHVMEYFASILLIFSAGTFLYVSTMHILPEIYQDQKRLSWMQLISVFMGFFFPMILTFGVCFLLFYSHFKLASSSSFCRFFSFYNKSNVGLSSLIDFSFF